MSVIRTSTGQQLYVTAVGGKLEQLTAAQIKAAADQVERATAGKAFKGPIEVDVYKAKPPTIRNPERLTARLSESDKGSFRETARDASATARPTLTAVGETLREAGIPPRARAEPPLAAPAPAAPSGELRSLLENIQKARPEARLAAYQQAIIADAGAPICKWFMSQMQRKNPDAFTGVFQRAIYLGLSQAEAQTLYANWQLPGTKIPPAFRQALTQALDFYASRNELNLIIAPDMDAALTSPTTTTDIMKFAPSPAVPAVPPRAEPKAQPRSDAENIQTYLASHTKDVPKAWLDSANPYDAVLQQDPSLREKFFAMPENGTLRDNREAMENVFALFPKKGDLSDKDLSAILRSHTKDGKRVFDERQIKNILYYRGLKKLPQESAKRELLLKAFVACFASDKLPPTLRQDPRLLQLYCDLTEKAIVVQKPDGSIYQPISPFGQKKTNPRECIFIRVDGGKWQAIDRTATKIDEATTFAPAAAPSPAPAAEREPAARPRTEAENIQAYLAEHTAGVAKPWKTFVGPFHAARDQDPALSQKLWRMSEDPALATDRAAMARVLALLPKGMELETFLKAQKIDGERAFTPRDIRLIQRLIKEGPGTPEQNQLVLRALTVLFKAEKIPPKEQHIQLYSDVLRRPIVFVKTDGSVQTFYPLGKRQPLNPKECLFIKFDGTHWQSIDRAATSIEAATTFAPPPPLPREVENAREFLLRQHQWDVCATPYEALAAQWGTTADQVLQDMVQPSGLSKEQLHALANSKPEEFYQLYSRLFKYPVVVFDKAKNTTAVYHPDPSHPQPIGPKKCLLLARDAGQVFSLDRSKAFGIQLDHFPTYAKEQLNSPKRLDKSLLPVKGDGNCAPASFARAIQAKWPNIKLSEKDVRRHAAAHLDRLANKPAKDLTSQEKAFIDRIRTEVIHARELGLAGDFEKVRIKLGQLPGFQFKDHSDLLSFYAAFVETTDMFQTNNFFEAAVHGLRESTHRELRGLENLQIAIVQEHVMSGGDAQAQAANPANYHKILFGFPMGEPLDPDNLVAVLFNGKQHYNALGAATPAQQAAFGASMQVQIADYQAANQQRLLPSSIDATVPRDANSAAESLLRGLKAKYPGVFDKWNSAELRKRNQQFLTGLVDGTTVHEPGKQLAAKIRRDLASDPFLRAAGARTYPNFDEIAKDDAKLLLFFSTYIESGKYALPPSFFDVTAEMIRNNRAMHMVHPGLEQLEILTVAPSATRDMHYIRGAYPGDQPLDLKNALLIYDAETDATGAHFYQAVKEPADPAQLKVFRNRLKLQVAQSLRDTLAPLLTMKGKEERLAYAKACLQSPYGWNFCEKIAGVWSGTPLKPDVTPDPELISGVLEQIDQNPDRFLDAILPTVLHDLQVAPVEGMPPSLLRPIAAATVVPVAAPIPTAKATVPPSVAKPGTRIISDDPASIRAFLEQCHTWESCPDIMHALAMYNHSQDQALLRADMGGQLRTNPRMLEQRPFTQAFTMLQNIQKTAGPAALRTVLKGNTDKVLKALKSPTPPTDPKTKALILSALSECIEELPPQVMNGKDVCQLYSNVFREPVILHFQSTEHDPDIFFPDGQKVVLHPAKSAIVGIVGHTVLALHPKTLASLPPSAIPEFTKQTVKTMRVDRLLDVTVPADSDSAAESLVRGLKARYPDQCRYWTQDTLREKMRNAVSDLVKREESGEKFTPDESTLFLQILDDYEKNEQLQAAIGKGLAPDADFLKRYANYIGTRGNFTPSFFATATWALRNLDPLLYPGFDKLQITTLATTKDETHQTSGTYPPGEALDQANSVFILADTMPAGPQAGVVYHKPVLLPENAFTALTSAMTSPADWNGLRTVLLNLPTAERDKILNPAQFHFADRAAVQALKENLETAAAPDPKIARYLGQLLGQHQRQVLENPDLALAALNAFGGPRVFEMATEAQPQATPPARVLERWRSAVPPDANSAAVSASYAIHKKWPDQSLGFGEVRQSAQTYVQRLADKLEAEEELEPEEADFVERLRSEVLQISKTPAFLNAVNAINGFDTTRYFDDWAEKTLLDDKELLKFYARYAALPDSYKTTSFFEAAVAELRKKPGLENLQIAIAETSPESPVGVQYTVFPRNVAPDPANLVFIYAKGTENGNVYNFLEPQESDKAEFQKHLLLCRLDLGRVVDPVARSSALQSAIVAEEGQPLCRWVMSRMPEELRGDVFDRAQSTLGLAQDALNLQSNDAWLDPDTEIPAPFRRIVNAVLSENPEWVRNELLPEDIDLTTPEAFAEVLKPPRPAPAPIAATAPLPTGFEQWLGSADEAAASIADACGGMWEEVPFNAADVREAANAYAKRMLQLQTDSDAGKEIADQVVLRQMAPLKRLVRDEVDALRGHAEFESEISKMDWSVDEILSSDAKLLTFFAEYTAQPRVVQMQGSFLEAAVQGLREKYEYEDFGDLVFAVVHREGENTRILNYPRSETAPGSEGAIFLFASGEPGKMTYNTINPPLEDYELTIPDYTLLAELTEIMLRKQDRQEQLQDLQGLLVTDASQPLCRWAMGKMTAEQRNAIFATAKTHSEKPGEIDTFRTHWADPARRIPNEVRNAIADFLGAETEWTFKNIIPLGRDLTSPETFAEIITPPKVVPTRRAVAPPVAPEPTLRGAKPLPPIPPVQKPYVSPHFTSLVGEKEVLPETAPKALAPAAAPAPRKLGLDHWQGKVPRGADSAPASLLQAIKMQKGVELSEEDVRKYAHQYIDSLHTKIFTGNLSNADKEFIRKLREEAASGDAAIRFSSDEDLLSSYSKYVAMPGLYQSDCFFEAAVNGLRSSGRLAFANLQVAIFERPGDAPGVRFRTFPVDMPLDPANTLFLQTEGAHDKPSYNTLDPRAGKQLLLLGDIASTVDPIRRRDKVQSAVMSDAGESLCKWLINRIGEDRIFESAKGFGLTDAEAALLKSWRDPATSIPDPVRSAVFLALLEPENFPSDLDLTDPNVFDEIMAPPVALAARPSASAAVPSGAQKILADTPAVAYGKIRDFIKRTHPTDPEASMSDKEIAVANRRYLNGLAAQVYEVRTSQMSLGPAKKIADADQLVLDRIKADLTPPLEPRLSQDIEAYLSREGMAQFGTTSLAELLQDDEKVLKFYNEFLRDKPYLLSSFYVVAAQMIAAIK